MPLAPQDPEPADSDDVVHAPLKAWSLRSAAMPWIPGSPDLVLPNLELLLRQIAKSPAIDERFQWADSGSETTVRAAVRAFGRSGLLVREASGALRLSSEAEHWLSKPDSSYLMALFHNNVRFFGELLASIQVGTTHEDLRQVAVQEFSLPWETLDQVRRRTTWFRAVGFVELWSSNELVVTDAGRAFLEQIELAVPQIIANVDGISTELAISEPGPIILREIEKLDQASLRNRKRAISYMPGGDPIDVIQQLVALAETPISREKFEQLCSQEFNIAETSAAGSLYSLRAANLLEQVGPTQFRVSEAAKEWLETDDPLDLVRLFHVSFVGVGELLTLMDDVIGAGELARRLEEEYGIERLATNEIARRLRILEAAGLVQRVTQSSYRVLPLGKAFSPTIPLLQLLQEQESHDLAEADGDVGVSERVASRLTELEHELMSSSTDVASTARFERAIAEVLAHLGFSATHIGGPGKTDVLVEAWLAPGSTRTVAVDAKTAANGSKDSLEFNVLREHRKLHKASVSVVVAPGFDGRLVNWAKEEQVVLIAARTLSQVLTLQASYPLPMSELAQIFSIDGVDALRDKWAAVKRQQDIMAEVVAALWRSANNTGHVKASGGALTARDLWLMTMNSEDAASQEEIAEVLDFLASPLISAVDVRKNESKVNAYSALSSPSTVAARLAAMHLAIRGGSRPALDSPIPELSEPQAAASRPPKRTSAPVDGPDPGAVRQWAQTQGIQVSLRGRLPSHLIEKYRRAHRDEGR
ncbi:histone-like nucleoid-structuring protein Lsr2 [Pseudonocardia sp. N23]|uniref:Lsr2 family DNA-binding protein n=1 Tax=Pseudonocardia sp. N23 TaxID=1987376 RepID=UPI000C0336BB|nr:histone-like nucleoid-structuring protein Lsr2 [Pseudonocardia sp. N23]GAY12707.1 hypothetical protein TOK_1256 [Pseudonocardia sp. N23]